MNIVFIHGHGVTSACFDSIRPALAEYPCIALDYDSDAGFSNNFDAMQEQLKDMDDIFFIAHSLGGIYALHLANAAPERVLGAVTISTPYGGSQVAQLVKYMMPFNQVLRDIQPGSAPIEQGNRFDSAHPWTNIVTTAGRSSMMMEANDGVVTADSMRHRPDIRLVDVDADHFSVLLDPATLQIIRESISHAETLAEADLCRSH